MVPNNCFEVKCFPSPGNFFFVIFVCLLNQYQKQIQKVGDLHGQLADLVHLINKNGLPSETNKYIFNGDFVDRGFQGVEVKLVITDMALTLLFSSAESEGKYKDHFIGKFKG